VALVEMTKCVCVCVGAWWDLKWLLLFLVNVFLLLMEGVLVVCDLWTDFNSAIFPLILLYPYTCM